MENQTEKKHYVYILRCADGSLYTGWTTHLAERVNTHNSGQGAKYTRSHRPVSLVYFECFSDKSEALKRECAIKAMTRQEKEQLIAKKE
ncbi:MAG: GIY-YIG nuclease family protein [Ruminococcaceae bacterium]|nr:GIY-YIG nuclease family protein [Oscillospiraceae bacterium]